MCQGLPRASYCHTPSLTNLSERARSSALPCADEEDRAQRGLDTHPKKNRQ